jgi:hypothetical protein
MIREFPNVPAAVELVDVARYIYRNGFVFPDPSYDNNWVWQSPSDFEPRLRVMALRDDTTVLNSGRLIVQKAVLVQIDGMNEYEVGIPVADAPRIKDDPYLEDFVLAYRQYPFGRSPLVADLDQMYQPGISN